MRETNRPKPDVQGTRPTTPPGETPDALPHDQRRARRPDTAVPLTRSRRNRVLGGVVGGVAEYVNADPRRLRLIVAGLSVLTGGVLGVVYLLLWLLLPAAP